MYLALRWLIGLSVAMWVTLCCLDFYNGRSKRNQGFNVNLFKLEIINNTAGRQAINLNRKNSITTNDHDHVFFHYAMFFAGACVVAIFNRKNDIILYTRGKIIHINFYASNFLRDSIKLKIAATKISIAALKYTVTFWEHCKKVIVDYLTQRKAFKNHYKIHLELMKKLREYNQERKSLGQFLISTIRENKNIRMQYQMETMAKKRLMRHIEDTQRQIKENHSKYISFQHLYLVTHQENIFLKTLLKKMRKEKEETEKKLIGLVNEVYHSKNIELKAYCTRFIVGTRDNLLRSDVAAEIQMFLHRNVAPSTSCRQAFQHLNVEAEPKIAQIGLDDESVVPLTCTAPKLKGLPGECIWTVKDKDGIIEKLYEYDYETDFDNGDTIRRIRKYSVYHDKDCLLDFENSKTTLPEISSGTITFQREQYIKVECPLTSHGFLTGSQAFRKFLQDNQNFIQLPTSHTTDLL